VIKVVYYDLSINNQLCYVTSPTEYNESNKDKGVILHCLERRRGALATYRPMKSETRDQCNARPAVTFPVAQLTNRRHHCLVTGTTCLESLGFKLIN